MKAQIPGSQLMIGLHVQSCRSQFKGVHMQLEGHIHNELRGISISMTYIEALDMAKALIYAAHRHGDIAVKHAESMVKLMNKKIVK